MKKVLFLMVSVLALTSCKVDLANWGANQIKPSDEIVTKTYQLDAFDEVNMSGVGHIELIQDEKKSGTIELTAPDNYVELYKFESKDGKLSIGFTKNNINLNTKHVDIKVYTADLIKLKNGGASSINMEKLDTDQLTIINSGVGSIRIAGIADNVEMTNSGVGSIDAQGLKALSVKATVSGVGSITCYASEKIEGRVSGVGSLKYAGNPKQTDNHRSGVGSISEL